MKQFKKVVASALALAMVVTAIPTADAQAAAKAPKLNNTKKILYVGQSYTLKVNNLPANWKKCTYTWSTSNKSIATIKKGKYGQAASVKAVKAGKTTITTKMTYPQTAAQKKAKKKTVKTFKCAVTVKNPTLTVKASATTLAVGATTKLSVSKAPSNAKVAYSSSDKTVATVSSNGTVKAVAPGKAVIKVTSTVGAKKLTKTVTITVAGEEGMTSTLSNPLSSEYPNTVLVNDQAVIKVSVVESGKPVAGRTIVGTFEVKTDVTDSTVNGVLKSGVEPDYVFKVNNTKSSTAVTDANGIATFVIGNIASNVKSYDDQWASVNFKAQDASTSKTVESTVSFATIKNEDITNINNNNLDPNDNLVPGTNYAGDGLNVTASMDIPADDSDEYVESQQVSSANADEHKVGFSGGYPVIYLPNTSSDLSTATKKVEEINHKSDAYHTYANDSFYYTLKEDPSKLTYATINFDNVTISKYTKLVVETYKNEADAKKAALGDGIDVKEYKGELAQSSFAYQVPLGEKDTYKGLCVKVTLVSEGQVDAAKNAGYNMKNITYVYKTNKTAAGTSAALKGATVTWAVVDTPMTAEEEITASTDLSDLKAYDTISSTYKKIVVPDGGKVTKKVPAFPYTGTAVLTVYDANGKVVDYYACATKNTGAIAIGNAYTFTKKKDATHLVENTNDIYKGAPCYLISVDELRDKVGEIVSQDGQNVWVDSKKSGRTTLEGTVKVDGKDLQLDAETNTVYTSIQWNPIPTAAAVTNSDAFVALLGQKIEVVAQLTDKNGNAVTLKDQAIDFKQGTTKIDPDTAKDVKGTVTNSKASIVQIDEKTDSNGQAKLILKASDVTEITNITAEAQSGSYNVVLKIADKTTAKADLYWIDADLAFTDSAYAPFKTTQTTTTKTNEVVNTGIEPKVGETWEYGVKSIGTTFSSTKYAGALANNKEIKIDNLGITMTKTADSVGTVDTNTGVNGMVKATSTKASLTKIVAALNSKTLTDKATVSQGTFAGTGAASINKKLTLNVNWKNDGMSAEVLNPTGTRVYGAKTTVFVKVADSYGNPVADGTKVAFKTDDAAATVGGSATKEVTTTDGIATVELAKGDNTRVTVIATVEGISDNVFTQTYTWLTTADVANDFKIDQTPIVETGKYQTVFDKEAKTITMVFTEDIVESSVVKEQFTVKYDVDATSGVDQAATVELAVNEAIVNGNTITLKLADVPATVNAAAALKVVINKATVKGVDYVVTSIDGVQLANGVDENAATRIIFKADGGKTEPTQKGNSNAKDALDALDAAADNRDIAAGVEALKTALEKAIPVTIADITIPAATNGCTYTLADGTGTAGTVNAGAGTITSISGSAGEEHTFTVKVTKGTGTAKTLTFKITIDTDTSKYTVRFVSES